MTMLATPCREWCGLRNRDGYGIRRATRFGTVLVHRQVWIMVNGPTPSSVKVRHLCDNPACYRYDHLVGGTQGENLADMFSKGRDRNQNKGKTHCVKGHEFTQENTYRYTRNHKPRRMCRACRRRDR